MKVLVAMSGGVDSSVAAAVLKKNGYEVIGVFIKVWQPEGEKWLAKCPWREERRDAMRVAARLGIPFLTFDFEQEYKQGVVDYMLAEYRAGRTPNPDVMCNKEIKFGAFFKKAKALGADYIATGHYAIKSARRDGKFALKQAKDKNKDQSYFLWAIPPAVLPHCLFPIGDYTKPQVRRLAKKLDLPTAAKPDSQGLCFIGQVDFKEFLKEFIAESRGSVVNEVGEIIGQHDGVTFYTIGERHGFRIIKKTPQDTPYYVISKDIVTNTLIVSHRASDESLIAKKEIFINQVNWLSGEPDWQKNYAARGRYREPLKPCRLISLEDTKIKAIFTTPIVAAPGQSLVIYDKDHCLGGGVIDC